MRLGFVNIYFAAKSREPLEAVCTGLAEALGLPKFEFDSHDTWRYAWSERSGFKLNITKSRDYRTIETWIAGCPAGVNYQLILTTDHEPPEFLASARQLLNADVIRYAELSPGSDA